jgi:PAS domain S-box-containing protein
MKKRLDATEADAASELLCGTQAQQVVHHSGVFPHGKADVAEMLRLVQSLQQHQIELEMQNEELVHAREEIEKGLERYTDLYEFAPVGYLTLDRDGTIRQVNLTGTRLLGQTRVRLVGSYLKPLLAPKSRANFESFIEKLFESRTRQACEVIVCPQGASPLTLELTGTVLSERLECRVVATDVTERKQAEREQERLRAQLAQAQRLEAIGTFAAGIAHDFNNILGGILAGLSVLELENGEDVAHHQDIQEMEALAKRGAELTKQLLGFACRGKYDVRPVDLARVISDTSTMFGRMHKDITVEIGLAPDLRAVLMDYSQLELVLLNLFTNSGQAMPEGGRLNVFAENVELDNEDVALHDTEPGHFVKLVITDTGVGMSPATKEHIFEPFFTTKESGQSAGLGLASVYGIVKNHAGFVTVRSELGQGTAFTLFLPATERVAASVSAPPSSVRRGTGTILVVDDEVQLVRVYARLLRAIGYEVLTASSGKQAVEILRQQGRRVSLVILDMIMPDMSGRQTFEAIQEIVPGTKVLLATGFSLEGQAQEIMAHGCSGIIKKPFDAATLSAKVQEIL